jgi:hypothetical protein
VVEYLRVFRHVGFFRSWSCKTFTSRPGGKAMEKFNPSVAQQIAQAAIACQHERTGHAPQSVAVIVPVHRAEVFERIQAGAGAHQII